MYNFKGVLTGILGASHGALINGLSWAALAGSMLLTLWIWRGSWAPGDASFDLRMAFTLLSGMFFNLYLFPQDSLLLILPVILFYNYLRQRGLPIRLYSTFILLCPVILLISEFSIGDKLGIRIPVVAMIILLGWMSYALWKESRNDSRAYQLASIN